jgi:uncharacterized Zn finger protein (UPF0148 family)
VYCPWCGDDLIERDERLVCRVTGEELSAQAATELRAVTAGRPLRALVVGRVRWGRNWHCPADGARMIEVAGVVACPICDRSLPGGLVYQLLEFHNHPRTCRA